MKLSDILTPEQLHALTKEVAQFHIDHSLHGGYMPMLWDALAGHEFEGSHMVRVAVEAERLAARAVPNDPPLVWDSLPPELVQRAAPEYAMLRIDESGDPLRGPAYEAGEWSLRNWKAIMRDQQGEQDAQD